MGGLNKTNDEWAYIGVGRDDGKEKGEYSPIIYRPRVWRVDGWRTVWLSETPDRPGECVFLILLSITYQHDFLSADIFSSTRQRLGRSFSPHRHSRHVPAPSIQKTRRGHVHAL
jgi:hypothetical protein